MLWDEIPKSNKKNVRMIESVWERPKPHTQKNTFIVRIQYKGIIIMLWIGIILYGFFVVGKGK